MSSRFFKLPASVFDETDLVSNPANSVACRAYLWLLHLSNFRGTFIKTIKGQTVTLNEGECAFTRKELSASLRASDSEVRYAINKLEKMHLINVKSTKNFTLISIGYMQVQPEDDQVLTKSQPDDNRHLTYNLYSDSDSESDSYTNTLCPEASAPDAQPVREEQKPKRKSRTFKKPTVEEIRAYIAENRFSFSAEEFFDYYEGNGWKVGRALMKDWQATARSWEHRRRERQQAPRQYGQAPMSKNERWAQEQAEEFRGALELLNNGGLEGFGGLGGIQ